MGSIFHFRRIISDAVFILLLTVKNSSSLLLIPKSFVPNWNILSPTMKFRLNHVGLVVSSISEVAGLFRALGLDNMTEPQCDPLQMVKAGFLKLKPNKDVHMEFIEPTSETSPISRFLRNRGGGLHHICLEVDGIEDMSQRLTEIGFQVISKPVECVGYDRSFPDIGTRNTRIAFFFLGKNLLIELLEREFDSALCR
jgi:methylmalonyl-CoA/ethylmalonyl-CoA epimerase